MSKIELLNEDCMEVMARYPDGYFDLAIVDPPYFKGVAKFGFYGEKVSNRGIKRGDYKNIEYWDANVPDQLYFSELYRVSKEQIIWGINYYEKFARSTGRIIWDKVNDDSSFSKAEIASCSLINSVQMYRFRWNGMLQGDMKYKETRIHPTQKPVNLYKRTIEDYAKKDFRILDTHLGSGSSAIAAHQYGISEFVGCEIDKDYYDAAVKRFDLVTSQQSLFKAS